MAIRSLQCSRITSHRPGTSAVRVTYSFVDTVELISQRRTTTTCWCQRFAARVKQAEGMKVQAVGGVTGIPVACGPDEVERWLSRQREELLTPLRRAMFGRIRPFNEGRNAGEYRAEVESYLSELTQVIPLWARADALVGRAPNLQLMLINKTEYNFAARACRDRDQWRGVGLSERSRSFPRHT